MIMLSISILQIDFSKIIDFLKEKGFGNNIFMSPVSPYDTVDNWIKLLTDSTDISNRVGMFTLGVLWLRINNLGKEDSVRFSIQTLKPTFLFVILCNHRTA